MRNRVAVREYSQAPTFVFGQVVVPLIQKCSFIRIAGHEQAGVQMRRDARKWALKASPSAPPVPLSCIFQSLPYETRTWNDAFFSTSGSMQNRAAGAMQAQRTRAPTVQQLTA